MKRKVRTQEDKKKFIEDFTDNKIIVKEFNKGNIRDVLYCNECKSEFKVNSGDFIRHYEKTGLIRHTCDATGVTFERFLIKVKNQQDIKLDEYSFIGEYIDYKTKIKCRHNECGYEWNVLPRHFTGTMATRCPKCNSGSRYEKLIEEYLNTCNIIFTSQYTNSVLGKRSYDFAIFNNNTIIGFIEFDGEQHDTIKFNMTEEEFNLQQISDNFKNKYAEDNTIPLLRIKYKNKTKYKSIIDSFLSDIM